MLNTQKNHIGTGIYTSSNLSNEKSFDNFFEERVNVAVLAKAKKSLKYRNAIIKAANSFEALMGSLETSKQRKYLLNLEAAWNEADSDFIECTYLQGLEDGSKVSELHSIAPDAKFS